MDGVWKPFSQPEYKRPWQIVRLIKQIGRDIKWSHQRIWKGYCDYDLFSIDDWFMKIMPHMLKVFKETRHGSPFAVNHHSHAVFLDEEERNQDVHDEWDKKLDRMVFLDYYTNYIKSRDDWEFVSVYTDEGISATSTKHRDGFQQMVDDALAGKIDLIVTKSVSRFARNTVDSLTTIRKLKEHGTALPDTTVWMHTLQGMQEDMRLYQNALERMSNEAVEYVRGVPVVKTFGQTVFSFHRFKASIDDYCEFCMHYTRMMRKSMLGYTVLINSAFVFILGVTLFLIRGEYYQTDILLNFLFYVIFTPAIATAMSKVMFMSENDISVSDDNIWATKRS